MGANSKIEWTDHTFSPWVGCTKISPACDHCYAERSAPARVKRAAGVETWGPTGQRMRTSKHYWKAPLSWNAEAQRTGTRPRVFCASLADVFDNTVPPDWRQNLMSLVVRTPYLDWLFLTNRIGNARKMLADASMHDGLLLTANDEYAPPPNLWLGITVCNQEEADRDIPKLLGVPAAKRFLSIEPLLGAMNLRHLNKDREVNEVDCLKPDTWEEVISIWRDTDDEWVEQFEDHYGVAPSDGPLGPMHPGIDWVIVGGESGPGARPMHPDWVRSLRDQCTSAGVPFFFKQMTKRAEIPADLMVREFPE